LYLAGGTLKGPGDLTVTGRFTWTDGTLAGGGQVTALGGLNLDGPLAKVLSDATLNNGGYATWYGTGDLYVVSGGVLNNLPGATFGSPGNGNTIYLKEGILSGFGTVNANIINGGQVSPGDAASTATLAINGFYTQTSTGTLIARIRGIIPGIEFDQVTVSGSAALDGTLNVDFLAGFVPGAADKFTILTFAASSGAFATVNGLNPSSAVTLATEYNSQDVTLAVTTVVAPTPIVPPPIEPLPIEPLPIEPLPIEPPVISPGVVPPPAPVLPLAVPSPPPSVPPNGGPPGSNPSSGTPSSQTTSASELRSGAPLIAQPPSSAPTNSVPPDSRRAESVQPPPDSNTGVLSATQGPLVTSSGGAIGGMRTSDWKEDDGFGGGTFSSFDDWELSFQEEILSSSEIAAALVTGTRPDIVPQKGSQVAPVATLFTDSGEEGVAELTADDEEMNLEKFLIDPARNFSRVLILPGPAAQQELEQHVGQQEPASIDQLLKEWKLRAESCVHRNRFMAHADCEEARLPQSAAVLVAAFSGLGTVLLGRLRAGNVSRRAVE